MAPLDPVRKALREYDDDFLLCRRGNLGHVWEVVGFFRQADGVVARRLECPRCGTTRTDHWDRTSAERHASTYHYADGYQMKLDGDYAGATDVRREVMRRANVFSTESQMLAAVTGTAK
jgi:hypothetical protein